MNFKDWINEKYPINSIVNTNNIYGCAAMGDNKVDLIITSPPYNVSIDYDDYKDDLDLEDYYMFVERWMKSFYRTLKPTGRIALNIPYDVNMKGRGGRSFILAKYWNIMEKVGFKFAGLVELEEKASNRQKLIAVGSWLKASAPYIYNPKECVIIAYKDEWIRKDKSSTFSFENTVEGKKEFMDLVSGTWQYKAQTKTLTKANFSLDIPLQALKILSYEGDLVMDPFMGSGQTAIACKMLNRNYIGFELSKEYTGIAEYRIQEYENGLV